MANSDHTASQNRSVAQVKLHSSKLSGTFDRTGWLITWGELDRSVNVCQSDRYRTHRSQIAVDAGKSPRKNSREATANDSEDGCGHYQR